MSARWKKVFADLWGNKRPLDRWWCFRSRWACSRWGWCPPRSPSSSTTWRRIISPINPHTARISTDDFDDDLLPSLARVPGVDAVEGRYDISVKITGKDGKQYQVNVTSIQPLDEIKVDQLVFEKGSRELGEHEIYLERQGAEGLGYKVGDMVDVLLTDGRVRT